MSPSTGSAGGPWSVTFVGAQAASIVAQIQGDGSTLVSGSVARTITTSYVSAVQTVWPPCRTLRICRG